MAAKQRPPPPPSTTTATQVVPEPAPQMPLPGYPQFQLQRQLAMNAAALQALIHAQQHPGWAGVDPALRMAYGGTLPFHPGSAIPGLEYPAFPGLPGNALLPQQILAMHQAQLALYPGFGQPPPQPPLPSQPVPAEDTPENDPFVYVQPEVKAAKKGVPVEIKKRALFTAPPARLRIAQACERCRKRKTKCTGEKPQCARCARRGFECEYVEEHRANRTKQAIAARQQAAMEASVEACSHEEHVPLVDAATLPICPPARHTYSSSSTCSDATTSSLPPPLAMPVPHGQPLYNLAAPSFSSSGFSDGSCLPSAMSTPAITLDGGPLPAPAYNFNASGQTAAPRPVLKARVSTQGKRPSPAKSMVDLRAASKSRSAPLPEYSEAPMHVLAPTPTPTPSTSCQACLAEMSDCSGCVDGGPLCPGVKQYFSPSHNRSHSMPPPLEGAEFPPLLFGEPMPEVKQILIDTLSKTLAKQAATVGTPGYAPLGLPPLSRDASTSSSGSSALSGALTPHDYFTFPSTREAVTRTLSPAGYGEAVPAKRSESTMMAEAHHGMYPSPPAMCGQEHAFSTDAEGALQFSEVFHSYSSLSDSLSVQE